LYAAIQEHFCQVPIAQRITQVLGDCLENQPSLELSAFEVILRLAFQLFNDALRVMTRNSNFWSTLSIAKFQGVVNAKNFATGPAKEHRFKNDNTSHSQCFAKFLYL
jgi:hypothetical protein